MDREDLRSILRTTGVDLWTLLETAISIAASNYGPELRLRRDGFVERLYAPPPLDPCRGSDAQDHPKLRREEEKGSSSPIEKVFGSSPLTPQSNHREELDDEEEDEEEEDDEDRVDVDRRNYTRPIDQEQRKILAIKESLEDPDQSNDSIAGLLQSLADMDITFKALQDTDIGRHVNGLRKHSSAEVRRLVKQLVRKWKEIVDEWVKASENSSPAIITDGESPQQIGAKSTQNGHKVPDFTYSPNPHNGRMSSSRSSNLEAAAAAAAPKRVAPIKPVHSTPPAKLKEEKESLMDAARLANARKRLHENYQEAQNGTSINTLRFVFVYMFVLVVIIGSVMIVIFVGKYEAKKQRTIQVVDMDQIPKPKNSFVARNRGGHGHHHQAKHW